jgi:hypothetical protein
VAHNDPKDVRRIEKTSVSSPATNLDHGMKPEVSDPVKWFDHFVIAFSFKIFLTQSVSLAAMDKWYDHLSATAAVTRFLTQGASLCELQVVRPLDGNQRERGALDARRNSPSLEWSGTTTLSSSS